MILGLLMMFYLMFLNLYLVLALVHLLFLHQNFGIAYLMICVPLSLLSVNPNSKHTYFVKLSLRISAFLLFHSGFLFFHLSDCFSFSLVVFSLTSPGVIASLAW